MNLMSPKLIEGYYQRFNKVEVIFTRDVIQATGLIAEQVQLKCGIDFWPCVLYSASFREAKIVINRKAGIVGKIQMADNRMSLKLSFKKADKPVTFFVTGIVINTAPYRDSGDSSLLTVRFPNRPPDDLIEILGRILNADVNSIKYKDERIVLTEETQQKLMLHSRDTAVFVQGVPRRCLLRELSFGTAKVILTGVAKFLIGKETSLRIDFDEPRESVLIKGKFTAAEDVEGKKEMLGMTMDFDEAEVPKNYKLRIEDCLSASGVVH